MRYQHGSNFMRLCCTMATAMKPPIVPNGRSLACVRCGAPIPSGHVCATCAAPPTRLPPRVATSTAGSEFDAAKILLGVVLFALVVALGAFGVRQGAASVANARAEVVRREAAREAAIARRNAEREARSQAEAEQRALAAQTTAPPPATTPSAPSYAIDPYDGEKAYLDCPQCNGEGTWLVSRSVDADCDQCNGRGWRLGWNDRVEKCLACYGTGRGHETRTSRETCDVCRGTGRVSPMHKLDWTKTKREMDAALRGG